MRAGARLVTTAGLLCSAGLVVALHVLRPDVPPASHRLSEYAIGPYGWMMAAAFVVLGCGLAALGSALLVERPRGTVWVVPAVAFVAGAGMVVSGVFETGVSDASELIHSRASIAATIALVGLILVLSFAPARSWTDVPRDGTSIGLALAATALALLAPVLHDTAWTGLGQRLLWVVLLSWVLRALWGRRQRDGYARGR